MVSKSLTKLCMDRKLLFAAYLLIFKHTTEVYFLEYTLEYDTFAALKFKYIENKYWNRTVTLPNY